MKCHFITIVCLVGALTLMPYAVSAQQRDQASRAAGQPPRVRKPNIDDTVKANVYADNSFELYINGELVAVDPIKVIPHNVVSVDILPAYPMTIAVKAIDNADPKTGMDMPIRILVTAVSS